MPMLGVRWYQPGPRRLKQPVRGRRWQILGLVVLAGLMMMPTVRSEEWPQFLGPGRDSRTAEVVKPWSSAPKRLWKQGVGPAHSSPVVAGGRVYAFYQPADKPADALAAFDARTGEKKWERSYPREAFTPPFGEGPRSTPTIAAGKVYTLGGTGVLACWKADSGDLIWKVDTLKEFQAENLTFGVSASPLVHEGRVYVNVGGKEASLVAFDADTGKTLWKQGSDKASYASPIAATLGSQPQIVFLTASGLCGVKPRTGEELWRYPFRDLLQESATTPLHAENLLVGSSVTLGSVALAFDGTDGKPAPTPAWRKGNLNCYFSTPVLVGTDTLYMLNGKLSINPTITLRCVDLKTGEVKWEKPNVGKYHAALIRTGDNKLLMLDDGGGLTLFNHDRTAYQELAKAKVCNATWAHPALVGGVLYVRDETDLIAIDLGS